MQERVTITVALFIAGFFAKDIIDDIFFLMIDKYPVDIFGFKITATFHKVMLVSIVLTLVFLYYGLRTNRSYE